MNHRKGNRKIAGAAYQAAPDGLTPTQKQAVVAKAINSAGTIPFPPRMGKPRKWMRRSRGRAYAGV